jgi:hypothetical protein
MKYLLMIYGNDETWDSFPTEELHKMIAEQDAFNKEFFHTGELLGAYGLADVVAAKTVRVREGAAAVTDGPYLESKEHLSSYYLLECENEARALEIAARMPYSSIDAVELWPVLHDGSTKV